MESEAVLACCLGSLGLYFMDSDDFRILKIVVFSRAVTSGVKICGELTGLFTPVESQDDKRIFTVESALGLVSAVFCCYIF